AGDVFVDDPEYLAKQQRSAFVKGLQKYTLETLVLTKEFLESHGLRFYLTEGTLLGAVRHNGFIPWDDDIDIAMPREDYDKLVQLANEGKIPPQLNFDSLENNKHHWVLGAKMQLTRPTPYIQHKVTKISKYNGPYVDIFPLDYWNNPAGLKAWFTAMKIKVARRLIFIKTGYSKGTKKKLERMIARVTTHFMPKGCLQKFAVKTLKKRYGGNHKYMVNLCSYYPYYKEIFPAGFFGEPAYIDFEGHKMPVPCEYDYMLKTVYGKSYDTIPPVRVTNMRKHAFDLKEENK
ncbi:MAG: LicD family protein, partial [Clostridia bacterium]|nr:LicD family protein [Clostridia bacterium]